CATYFYSGSYYQYYALDPW
nr:immunoglobulin heavy chain junction region [Macaca mulatta]MOX93009.1 immunoglobulin heavy chain junction region [Macaca mulatta]MOX96235.1 immunoglobulin heavy chain junction region [Macaca mulatta]